MSDAAGLIRRPKSADNAAMEAEPTKVEPPKRKRRHFQFRLRTLMIMVALLSVYCGPFAWLLQDRQRLIRELDESRAAERRTSRQLERAILVVEQQQRKLLSAIREIVVSNTTLVLQRDVGIAGEWITSEIAAGQ